MKATALGFPAWDEGAQGLQIARVNLSGNGTLLHIRRDNLCDNLETMQKNRVSRNESTIFTQ